MKASVVSGFFLQNLDTSKSSTRSGKEDEDDCAIILLGQHTTHNTNSAFAVKHFRVVRLTNCMWGFTLGL